MASLEKRGQNFRIVFRYDGVKYARALSTRSEKTPQAALARLEDNLHCLELGTLNAPDGGELAEFRSATGDRRAPRPPSTCPSV